MQGSGLSIFFPLSSAQLPLAYNTYTMTNFPGLAHWAGVLSRLFNKVAMLAGR